MLIKRQFEHVNTSLQKYLNGINHTYTTWIITKLFHKRHTTLYRVIYTKTIHAFYIIVIVILRSRTKGNKNKPHHLNLENRIRE